MYSNNGTSNPPQCLAEIGNIIEIQNQQKNPKLRRPPSEIKLRKLKRTLKNQSKQINKIESMLNNLHKKNIILEENKQELDKLLSSKSTNVVLNEIKNLKRSKNPVYKSVKKYFGVHARKKIKREYGIMDLRSGATIKHFLYNSSSIF
jgi:hypothetical protein